MNIHNKTSSSSDYIEYDITTNTSAIKMITSSSNPSSLIEILKEESKKSKPKDTSKSS